MLLNATTRRDRTGEVTGVIGIAQDITELKFREVEMDRLLQEAKQLIETANAPVFGVDKELRVTEWNQKAVEISEFSKGEVQGKPFLDFLADEVRAPVEAVLSRALDGEQTANYELQLTTKAGKQLYLAFLLHRERGLHPHAAASRERPKSENPEVRAAVRYCRAPRASRPQWGAEVLAAERDDAARSDRRGDRGDWDRTGHHGAEVSGG